MRGTEEVVGKTFSILRGSFPTTSSVPLPSAGEVYGTGGGSRSDVWMQCRADATGRAIHRPVCGESAFGAAVLSAAGAHYNSIVEAVARMVRLERTFTPDRQRAAVCDRLFDRFCGELRKRGYL